MSIDDWLLMNHRLSLYVNNLFTTFKVFFLTAVGYNIGSQLEVSNR